MPQSITPGPSRLSEAQLDTLRDQLGDAANRMSDDQILGLADSLHNALRARRERRARVNDRLLEGRSFDEPRTNVP